MSEDTATPDGGSGAVIFQAPQPSAPRSRRASAPAGEPVLAPPPAPANKKAASTAKKKPTAAAEPAERAPEPAGASDDSGESGEGAGPNRRRRGGRGRGGRPQGSVAEGPNEPEDHSDEGGDDSDMEEGPGGTRRRRRRRGGRGRSSGSSSSSSSSSSDDSLAGSTRLQAKRQRRRDGRETRRPILSEAEFLARRESVKRSMVVREKDGRVQIAVLEDDILVEHYVSHQADSSMAGNVYLARVQNVLPGMEAAFVDIGRGRNAVL